MMISIICVCVCCNWFARWKQKKQLQAHIAANSPKFGKSLSKNKLIKSSSGTRKSNTATVYQPNWQTEAGKSKLGESNQLLSNPGRKLSIMLTDPDGIRSEI